MPGSPQLFLTLSVLFILAIPLSAYAETKVLTAEATYTMGDGETPSGAEAMALQKAKQMALEQAGTYVESYTKVQNYTLTADEIQTIAGGVLQVEVLEKKRELIGDGMRHYVRIKATVTTDKIADLAQRIKGKNVAEEYKKLQEEYARLIREIEKWKQLVAKTPSGPERETVLGGIRERERAFESVQEQENALFMRLVSGQALVKAAENQQELLDRLARRLIEEGHLVTIGRPESYLRADNKVILRVPVAVQGNEALVPFVQEVSKKLGGGRLSDVTRGLPELRKSLFGSEHRRIVSGRLTVDRQAAAYLRKKLSKFETKPSIGKSFLEIVQTRDLQSPFFNLKFVLDDGTEIFPCAYWASHGPRGAPPRPRRMFVFADNEKGEGTFIIQLDPIRYKVSLEMPASLVKQIRSISARYEEKDRSLIEFVNHLQDFLTKEERKKLGLDRNGVASPLTNIPDLYFTLFVLADHPELPLDPSVFIEDGLTPADQELLTRLLVILGERRKEFRTFLKEKVPACTLSEADSP